MEKSTKMGVSRDPKNEKKARRFSFPFLVCILSNFWTENEAKTPEFLCRRPAGKLTPACRQVVRPPYKLKLKLSAELRRSKSG